jgi:uncharacterized protein (TIGR00299 family) protein
VDPFSGLSGDIFVGGFLALGAEEAALRALLRGLPFNDLDLGVERVMRCGIEAVKASIVIGGVPDRGETPQLLPPGARRLVRRKSPGHAHGATWKEIDGLLAKHLPGRVAEVARAAFEGLAAAEAQVHGMDLDGVHFHEVGVQDSIADVALAAAGWVMLGEPEVHVGPLALGKGRTRMAHGDYPIPGPATLLLLSGFETTPGVAPPDRELTTPTGAALARSLAGGKRSPQRFIPEQVAFAAGGWDFPDSPNVARFILGSIPGGSSELIQLESNLDDATPQQVAHAQARMLEAGALDVWVVPATFKKGRSGWVIGAVVFRSSFEAVSRVLGSELPTLGIRYWPLHRVEAERRFLEGEHEGRPVSVKEGRWPWATHLQPEFEEARRASDTSGTSLREVQDSARRSAQAPRRRRP